MINKYKNLSKKEREYIKESLLKIGDYKCGFCGVSNKSKFYTNADNNDVLLDAFGCRWAKHNNVKIKEKSLVPVIKNKLLDAYNIDNYYLMCLECKKKYNERLEKYRKSILKYQGSKLNKELYNGVEKESIEKGIKLFSFFKAHDVVGVTLATCVDLIISFENSNIKK